MTFAAKSGRLRDVLGELRPDETSSGAEVDCQARWGCSLSTYQHLRSMHPEWALCPIGRFCSQKNAALNRGIAWEMTLQEWWDIWEASGKYPERGVRVGQYCMARYGDEGPYSPENVRIATVEENSQEYWNPERRSRIQEESQRKRSRAESSRKHTNWGVCDDSGWILENPLGKNPLHALLDEEELEGE